MQLEKEQRKRTKHLLALGKVEKKIENIEFQLMPKASLISMSEIEKVSGVGEKTAKEFKSVGITKVEDLLIEDSKSIAQKTKISDNKIENIQLTAQLLMIPGTNGKTVRLLQKAGIDAIEKLAKEDTIRLFRKIAKVTEENEYRPTLEEIASYIKYARTNYAF
jgi:predicted RecB family nuclease